MSLSAQKAGTQTLARRVSSGISGLDTLLDGGFPEGKVVLVLGEPGTGKTIMVSQFLHNGVTGQGDKGVYIGLNEPKIRFTAEMMSLGMDFSKLEREGKFAYVDATEVRRIPEQPKVGTLAAAGGELGVADI